MPLLQRFRIQGRYFVYDAVTNRISETTAAVYRLLPAFEKWRRSPGREAGLPCRFQALALACRRGDLGSGLPRLSNPMTDGAWKRKIPRLLAALSLGLTEQCTLRCAYCAFTANQGTRRTHSSRTLSLDLARQALEYYRDHHNPQKRWNVSFYGGEPLLAFARLRQIIALAKRLLPARPLFFSLTTNGTRLTPARIRFLARENVHLVISLDGPRHVHDRYRRAPDGSGSFDQVMAGLRRIQRLAPDYFRSRVSVHMVIAPPIDSAGIEDFLRRELGVAAGRVSVTLADDSETGFLHRHPYSIADQATFRGWQQAAESALIAGRVDPYALSAKFRVANLRALAKRNVSDRSGREIIPTGQCGPGEHKFHLDARGRWHLCEKINEGASLGDVHRGVDWGRYAALLESFYRAYQADCAGCFAQRLCEQCVVQSASQGGWDPRLRRRECTSTRLQLRRQLQAYLRILLANPTAFRPQKK